MSLQYDATRLKAVACKVNATFDLLLCNLAKSGVIQLAGVDDLPRYVANLHTLERDEFFVPESDIDLPSWI